MFTDRESLRKAEGSVFSLSRELAESLLRTTRNKKLKKLIEKDSFIITSKIRDEIFTKVDELKNNMAKAREASPVKSGIGRKRKDYTDEEFAQLSPEEQKRYKYAKWQRDSRYKRGITKNP